jgi:hypothetical protein
MMPEHKEMVLEIMTLPDCPIIPWTSDQRSWLQNEKNFYQMVATRIDYLQARQLGFLPNDPSEHPLLTLSHKNWLKAYSQLLFSTLQIVVNGWELIREAALKDCRQFNFANPRKLFVEICREDINTYALEHVFSHGANRGIQLKELRRLYREEAKFYRGGFYENEEEKLLELRAGNWEKFCIFAIWNYRLRCKNIGLKYAWKSFFEAHKIINRLIQETKIAEDGGQTISLQWHNGEAFNFATSTPVQWVDS